MFTLRFKLLNGIDRALALGIAALVLGASIAFGGSVWWGRPAIVGLGLAVTLAWLARVAVTGPWRVLKSPLSGLGALALMLGLAQLVPLPPGVIGRISSRSLVVNATGVIREQALVDDPTAVFPEAPGVRSPLSLDRPATLRWAVGAGACLALFVVASHFSDRLGNARVVWGSVIAAFFVNVVLAAVQLSGGSEGLYGHIEPGSGPAWAPTLEDALASPTASVLRPVGDGKPDQPAFAASKPGGVFLIGTMMGGPGAFLALGSLALPLALGLSLQLMGSRGGREGILARLRESGQGSQVALMMALLIAGALLTGILAGRRGCPPFVAGLLIVGLFGSWSSGIRKLGLATTALVLASLAGGVALGDVVVDPSGRPSLPRLDWDGARRTTAEAWTILRDFPVFGTGFGTFATIHPYYKATDAASATAMSSLAQWSVESGAVGIGLLASAGLWCLVRLPGSIRRVGTADRSMAFGLVGALTCFAWFSAIHWTVELSAIALAASAVAGTANRWLAGGTDLFVDLG